MDGVKGALERLRAAADRIGGGFPTTQWWRVSGSGPEALELNGAGGFAGLVLEPGGELVLSCDLNLPESVDGVRLAGDPLEATLFSLYPTDLLWNGSSVFSDPGVPVAAGPALFEVVPELRPGASGRLEFRVRVPNNQTTLWLNMKFTTPGLRARFERIDVAWAQLALADAVAVQAEERQRIADAASLLPDPLPTEEGALRDALAAMADRLSPFHETIRRMKVHLIGHSHIDMNWLWTWPDTVEVIRRDFRSVLDLMRDYPELTFSHSQPATYEVIRRMEPELFRQVLERIREGRWEPIGMTWVEGDVNMASGEAHARQLLEGVRYSRETLGCEPATLHEPDTFGHAGNLPQIAASAGARAYYHHRANPGQADQWPAYWWEGQDGTRLLAISTPSYNGDILARDLAQSAIRARRFGHPLGLHFHGIGDHGGGPSRQNLDALRRFRETPLLPEAFPSTIGAYTRELLDSGVGLPVHRGESSTIFEGCYTTHADTKRYNRHGENLLCTADALAAMAGIDRTEALRPAWRAILFNQFHDILDGSAIHEAYEKNAADFEEAKQAAESVAGEALDILFSDVEAGRIAVANPLGWDREDWVELPDAPVEGAVRLLGSNGHSTTGQRTDRGLGFVARVPAFGTAVYEIVNSNGEAPVADGEPAPIPVIEAVPAFAPTDGREVNFLAEVAPDTPYWKVVTPHFRAYIRRDSGIIVSLHDKRVGRELVGFGMRRASDYLDTARADLALNVFQIIDEHPHGMSSWHYDEVHAESSLLRGAAARVIETGPARCVLEVEHRVRESVIRQRIVFYRDLPRIDFEAAIDWNEIGSPEKGIPNLKASFTARLPECEAWFETPFAAVRRPSDGQETPALRWADVGGDTYGIAVLNDSKYGHDALGGRLRLTLLRSAYEPDAVSDTGRHAIRYSLVPHPGSWREAGVMRRAADFNQPLLARRVAAKSATPARVSPAPVPAAASDHSSVLISGIKRACDGSGIVVRLVESQGRTVTAAITGCPEGAPIWETNLIEDRTAALEPRNGSLSLAFRPWQVRTLLIGDAG